MKPDQYLSEGRRAIRESADEILAQLEELHRRCEVTVIDHTDAQKRRVREAKVLMTQFAEHLEPGPDTATSVLERALAD